MGPDPTPKSSAILRVRGRQSELAVSEREKRQTSCEPSGLGGRQAGPGGGLKCSCEMQGTRSDLFT
jgi:hypothetical protein